MPKSIYSCDCQTVCSKHSFPANQTGSTCLTSGTKRKRACTDPICDGLVRQTKVVITKNAVVVMAVVVVAFSSHERISEEGLTILSPPALFFFFFLKWRAARAEQFHSLGQDQFIVAQRAETTSRVFPYELRVSSFPSQGSTLSLDNTISPLRLL